MKLDIICDKAGKVICAGFTAPGMKTQVSLSSDTDGFEMKTIDLPDLKFPDRHTHLRKFLEKNGEVSPTPSKSPK
jgi:hypothetical protein